MNYGKKSVKQKKKALQSTSSKLGRKCLLTFSKVLLLCVIAIGIIGICAGLGVFKGIIDSAPTITLEDATPTRYSSFIYDSKGNQMAKLIAEDSNRVPVTMDQIPTDLANAFVAIEDERFYQHNGIDIMGILRAGVTAVKTGFKRQEGASTITQQLAKNVYFTQEKRMARKAAEVFAALDIEKHYSKQEIFEMYVNTIYFGNGCYGVAEAAEGYFKTDAASLTAAQAVVLAGLPQAPSVYASSPALAHKRARVVLQRMVDCHKLTQDAAAQLSAETDVIPFITRSIA